MIIPSGMIITIDDLKWRDIEMSNVKIEIREKEMKLREVQEEIRLKEEESERLKKEIQLLSNELIDDSENSNQDFDEPPFPDGFWNIPY